MRVRDYIVSAHAWCSICTCVCDVVTWLPCRSAHDTHYGVTLCCLRQARLANDLVRLYSQMLSLLPAAK